MNPHSLRTEIAVSAAGHRVYLATPEENGTSRRTLLMQHGGIIVDLLDLADKILNLTNDVVSVAAETQTPKHQPSPYRNIRGGTECFCLQCQSEGVVYGQPTSSGVTAAWCGACKSNAYLVPLDKLLEFAAAYADSYTMEWLWPKPMRGDQRAMPGCSGGPCGFARRCEGPGYPGCSVPDTALPLLGFVKRPVLKSKGS